MDWNKLCMNFLFAVLYTLSFSVHLDASPQSDETMTEILKMGKEQYQLLLQKSLVGDCWKNAIVTLNEQCRNLNQNNQQLMALRFTNCFLEMSGESTYSCIEDKKDNLRGICISSMSDRAFNVYTEFYAHTQNMCFYLYNKVWSEETARTIDVLSSTSMLVIKQLEGANKLQSELLKQQQESLTIQSNIVEHGKSLARLLDESHHQVEQLAEDFMKTSKQQTTLLYELFEHLNDLQSWAISKAFWISTVLYYTISLLLVLLLTSTNCTANARFPIFLALSINLLAEQVISYIIVTHDSEKIQEIDNKVMNYIYISRNICSASCFILLLTFGFMYCDYDYMNYKLLKKMGDQSESITTMLIKLLELHKSANDIDDSVREGNETDELQPNRNIKTSANVYKQQSEYSDLIKKNETKYNLMLNQNKENYQSVHTMRTRSSVEKTNTQSTIQALNIPQMPYTSEMYHTNGSFTTTTPKYVKSNKRKYQTNKKPFELSNVIE